MEITVSQMTFQRRKAFSPKINNATFIWTSGREIVHSLLHCYKYGFEENLHYYNTI
jgi:hypothetical protein